MSKQNEDESALAVAPGYAPGEIVVATRDIWKEADEDSPAMLYARSGDLLEVRRCHPNDYWTAYVAHPGREPNARFGVSSSEIRKHNTEVTRGA